MSILCVAMLDTREILNTTHLKFRPNGSEYRLYFSEPYFEDCTFLQFLDMFHIQVPDYCKYALFDCDTHAIKFRDCGSHLDVFLTTYKLNPKFYDLPT